MNSSSELHLHNSKVIRYFYLYIAWIEFILIIILNALVGIVILKKRKIRQHSLFIFTVISFSNWCMWIDRDNMVSLHQRYHSTSHPQQIRPARRYSNRLFLRPTFRFFKYGACCAGQISCSEIFLFLRSFIKRLFYFYDVCVLCSTNCTYCHSMAWKRCLLCFDSIQHIHAFYWFVYCVCSYEYICTNKDTI